MGDLRSSAAKGVVWSVLQQWGKRMSALVVFVVLVRLLEPDAFGLLGLATVFVALFAIVQEQGFSSAVVQREDLEDLHLDTAFWFSVASGLALFALLQAIAGPIAWLFPDADGLETVLRVLSLLFLLGAVQSTPGAILRRSLQFKVLALRDLLAQVVGGAVGIGVALAGGGVWALVTQQLVAQAVAVVTLWTATRWRPRARASRRHLKDLWSFGFSVLGIQLLGFTNRRSDDLLIGAFLGVVSLGLYTIAYRVLTLLTELFINTISSVAGPTFARLQRERERLVRAFLSATRMAAFVSFPAFVGVSALAPEITRGVLGPDLEEVVPVMRVLALAGAAHTLTWLVSSVVTAVGKPSWNVALGLVNTVLNVSLFFMAIQLGWGILGVASVFVVRSWVMLPAHPMLVRRLLGLRLRDWARAIAPIAASAALMWGATVATTTFLLDGLPDLVALVLGGLVAVAVYALGILVLARDLPREALAFARSARRPAAAKKPAAAPDPAEPDVTPGPAGAPARSGAGVSE